MRHPHKSFGLKVKKFISQINIRMSLYASSKPTSQLTNQPTKCIWIRLYVSACEKFNRNKERKENEMKTNRQLQQFTEKK